MASELLSAPVSFVEFIPQDGGLYPVDREVPVLPLTDARMGQLPPVERMAILNERRLTYARPQLETHFVIPLEEVRPATLDLAATIVDVKSKDGEVKYYSARLEDGRKAYEAEKAAIRSGKRGKKGIEKKVADLAVEWQARSAELRATIQGVEAQKNSTIDGFVRSTFLTPGGVDSFLLASQDLEEQSYFFTSDSVNLLKRAQERLKTVTDPEAIKALSYKSGTGGIVVKEQIEPLNQIESFAFGPERTGNINVHIKNTAESLIDFYWNNSKSFFPPEDSTPIFAILHDLHNVAMASGDIDTIINSTNYIGKKLIRDLPRFKEEFRSLARGYSKEQKEFYARVMGEASDMNLSLDDYIWTEEFINKMSPAERGVYSVGVNTDRVLAFTTFSNLFNSLGSRNLVNVWTFNEMDQFFDFEFLKRNEIFFKIFEGHVSLKYPNSLARIRTETALDSEAWRSSYFVFSESGFLGGTKLPTRLNSNEEREKYMRFRLKAFHHIEFNRDERELIEFLAAESIFYGSPDAGLEDVLERHSENKKLFELIKNHNMWFVAEQGDQFSSASNPELGHLGIKSLTIYPLSSSRGYSISFDTELRDQNGEPLNFELLLDSNGDLLPKHEVDSMYPKFIDVNIKNFIYRRLHYITSGALGERGKHANGEVENGEAVTRRSHWRVLNSTPDRKITLNSPQAKAHAEYVLETYGIDIYEENLRRKLAGTLGENQVLTFVRAVTSGKAEPNQLVYKEELLNLAPVIN